MSTISDNRSSASIHLRMKYDPRTLPANYFIHHSRTRGTVLLERLPLLQPGAIGIEQSDDPIIPAGFIPVSTISVEHADNAYSIDAAVITDLIDRELLDHAGDFSDPRQCYVDLELAVRAHALVARGEALGWSKRQVDNRIASRGEDDDGLRRLLGQFMRAHRLSRAHQGAIVGFRYPEPGIDLGRYINMVAEFSALYEYRAGR